MTTTSPAQGGAIQRGAYTTQFGSLAHYDKGGVQLVADDARHYAFSNVFEVAATTPAWERVAVAKNMEYVLEVTRAEGTSPWFGAAHDEFAICMDDAGAEVLVELVKLDTPAAGEQQGAVALPGEPSGPAMGRIHLRRGHQALLPAGSAYRFTAAGGPGVLLLQTVGGPLTRYRWAEICQTV